MKPAPAIRRGAVEQQLPAGGPFGGTEDVRRLLRGHRHAGLGLWRVGLRATGRELTVWSFIVATAHGAGLMAAPIALRAVGSGAAGHSGHASHASAALATVVPVDWATLWATSVHTVGYLLVTAVLAVVVYERAALHLLRRAWINVDLVWAAALVLDPAGGDAFLGTQGDVWDAQSDMLFAGLGAVVGLVTLTRLHDRELQRLDSA